MRIGLAQTNPTVGDIAGNAAKIVKAIKAAEKAGASLVAFPELALTGSPLGDLVLRRSFRRATAQALVKVARAARRVTAIVGFIEDATDGAPATPLPHRHCRLVGGRGSDIHSDTRCRWREERNGIYNAAAVLHAGKVAAVCRKSQLSSDSAFNETRYVAPRVAGHGMRKTAGPAGSGALQEESLVVELGGLIFGLTIGDETWTRQDILEAQVSAGADLLLNISASPYHLGGWQERAVLYSCLAARHGVFMAIVNMVGGQDELVFDGGCFVVKPSGKILARAPLFVEGLMLVDVEIGGRPGDCSAPFRGAFSDASTPSAPALRSDGPVEKRGATLKVVRLSGGPRSSRLHGRETPSSYPLQGFLPAEASSSKPAPLLAPEPAPVAEVYAALCLACRDYARKNGFNRVIIGLSGGIDSALVATIAVDALGAENVLGLYMPSRFSAERSKKDVQALARNLEIELLEVPIRRLVESYKRSFLRDLSLVVQCGPCVTAPLRSRFGSNSPARESLHGVRKDDAASFRRTISGATAENLQARIRANILMALSNHGDYLLLNTGNRSEGMTGYATLYGDSAGGFALLKDIPKTLVYELSHYRNSRGGHQDIRGSGYQGIRLSGEQGRDRVAPRFSAGLDEPKRPEPSRDRKGAVREDKSSAAPIPQGSLTREPTAELRPGQKDSDTLPPYDVLDPILAALLERNEDMAGICRKGFKKSVIKDVFAKHAVSEYKRRQCPPGPRIIPRRFGDRVPMTRKWRE